jgi:hypothetical protein
MDMGNEKQCRTLKNGISKTTTQTSHIIQRTYLSGQMEQVVVGPEAIGSGVGGGLFATGDCAWTGTSGSTLGLSTKATGLRL